MDQQRIWAPWRLGYVSGSDSSQPPALEPREWLAGADAECFLCRACASYDQPADANRQNLVVSVGESVATVLNRYPYCNGHLLVCPRRHVGEFSELTAEEHLEAMQTLVELTQTLTQLLSAEGFNIGLNLGHVGGAGLPGHLHWHLVPRWSGDHNFMSSLAGIRVIPQSLEALWEALVEAKA